MARLATQPYKSLKIFKLSNLHQILRLSNSSLTQTLVLSPLSTSEDTKNNFLVNNATQALVSRLVVKFASEKLQDTNASDPYKLYEDFFLPKSKCQNMFIEGIQSEDFCKIHSDAGDMRTSGVDKGKKQFTETNSHSHWITRSCDSTMFSIHKPCLMSLSLRLHLLPQTWL